MTGRRTTGAAAALVPAVAVGLLLLVWATAAGPVALVSPSGRRRADVPPPAPSAEGTPSGAPSTLKEATEDVVPTADLSWLGDLIGWAIFLSLVVGAGLLLRAGWRARWRRPPRPADVDVGVLPETRLVEELRADAAERLAAVADGEVRDAIVRCWLRLEQSIAAAGLPRDASETSSEYVVRVLHRLDLDPRAVDDLAGLYREARFSDHRLDEDARDRARRALETLHADLDVAGTAR